ncbi:MAG: phosphate signaling complex protein PhoU [Coriobacteriia bacterium]|nr:phosphate signaling complex protein PhoU [Coriobacteriia bacterium]
MRETYRQDLRDIYDEAIGIFEDVAVTVRQSVKALVEADVETAKKIIEGDDEVNRRTTELEEKILQITATQFPVARDVRLLQSLVSISMHIERIGDLCVSIARTTLRTADKGEPSKSMLDLIQAQGNLVYRVLDTTIAAMRENDLEMAAKLPELDEPIDELYGQFFREVARLKEKKQIKWASRMVLASRYLERIADHSIDIGERLVFLITGERASLEEVAEELAEERKLERSEGPEDIDENRVGAL